MNDYTYNTIEGDTIYVKQALKQKGKEYGIIKLNKKLIYALTDSIDLMSSSPISPKFSEVIEKYLLPRFNEINEILYIEKSLPDTVSLEISKENRKEITHGLELGSVLTGLKDRGYNRNELLELLKKVQFIKSK
ncbi:MAG: hypothetical protein ACFE9T_05475 [Promethearchaeota archaeon]